MTPEPLDVEPVASPPPRTTAGQGKLRLDTTIIKQWMQDNVGEWCRIVGTSDRAFTPEDVNALRKTLTGFLAGAPYVEIVTRRRPGGYSIYVRLHNGRREL